MPHEVDLQSFQAVDAHTQWINCISERRQPEVGNAWTARHVTEVLLAGIASSKSGAAVPIHSRLKPVS